MEELIREAFLHVDVLGPHVAEGHYDLLHSDGYIILPSLWEAMVQPGWTVNMHMWPIPEPKPEPKPEEPAVEVVEVPEVAPPPPPAKKKKKARGSDFWFPQPRSRPKTKKKAFGVIKQQLPPDVARIADYRPKETEDAPESVDEVPEDVLPSDADKVDVAQYYLMKWTTSWESARDRDERLRSFNRTVEELVDKD